MVASSTPRCHGRSRGLQHIGNNDLLLGRRAKGREIMVVGLSRLGMRGYGGSAWGARVSEDDSRTFSHHATTRPACASSRSTRA